VQHSSDNGNLVFFVELDRDLTRRIVVQSLGAGRYALDIFTQEDRGFEHAPDRIEVTGKAALAARLVDEGVSPEIAYDELEMDTPARRPVLFSLLLSGIVWLAAAAAAVALGRSLWSLVAG
jgi:hypothetical protein